MRGKQICEALKLIRRDIADANGIKLDSSECKYRGTCAGTCPKCEAEVQTLELELENRRKSGGKTLLSMISKWRNEHFNRMISPDEDDEFYPILYGDMTPFDPSENNDEEQDTDNILHKE